MQIRIKLTFIGLSFTNKHCNKHCLALTKTSKRQRIEEFSLFVFQDFSLNGIYNFFRCEINDKVTTILHSKLSLIRSLSLTCFEHIEYIYLA